MWNDNRCYVVAEIGLNHNGSMELAKQLIDVANDAGCDAVKFQKRTPELCVPEHQRNVMRETPWGTMTYMDYRYKVEFEREQYDEIDAYCKQVGIDWTASPWDWKSADFLASYKVPFIKIPSAMVTDKALLEHCARSGVPMVISTGMCDLPMIKNSVRVIENAGGQLECIYHCTSTYPAQIEELNLLGIQTLKREFPHYRIGYSGHETGVPTSIMAAVLGAVSIERHITLNRAMWGSDHAASLEPKGLQQLVNGIRAWERARGDGVIKVYESELPIAKKLRMVDTVNVA